MADYEVTAVDDATMQKALTALGLSFNSGKKGTTTYAVDYYGTKWIDSGSTVVEPKSGTVGPVLVQAPGVYANVRWMGASAVGFSGITGASMKLLTAPYYRTFA